MVKIKVSKFGYYSNLNILFEIIHQLKNRETCFIPLDGKPVRWKKAHSIRFLKMHWERYGFLQNKMNLYHSCATYMNIPTMSYSVKIQKEQQKDWSEVFHYHIVAYDWFMETDSEDKFNQAQEDSAELKKIQDRYNLTYTLKFSGSKGFHHIVPYSEFKELKIPIYNKNLKIKSWINYLKNFPMKDLSKTDLVSVFKALSYRIKLMHSLDTLDTSVQDIKRVMKTAYSLDDKSGLVAYPLDDNQFNNFSKTHYDPHRVLGYKNYRRGLLWRNTNKKAKIKELLIDYGILEK